MINENSQKNLKTRSPKKRRKNCNKIFSKNLLKKNKFLKKKLKKIKKKFFIKSF